MLTYLLLPSTWYFWFFVPTLRKRFKTICILCLIAAAHMKWVFCYLFFSWNLISLFVWCRNRSLKMHKGDSIKDIKRMTESFFLFFFFLLLHQFCFWCQSRIAWHSKHRPCQVENKIDKKKEKEKMIQKQTSREEKISEKE